MSELTHKEVSARGGRTKAERHPEQFAEMGRNGGNTTKERYGIEHYREINRKGTLRKWEKKLKAGTITKDEYMAAIHRLETLYNR